MREPALLAGVLGGLAAVLLAVVDGRRGFLFHDYAFRSPFGLLHPGHLAMATAGLVTLVVCLRRWDAVRSAGVAPGRWVSVALPLGIATLLVADLFIYRLVPASRSLASGQISLDWLNAFGVEGLWRPLALAASYALTVWHATVLGILLSALALTALPWTLPVMHERGFRASLAGVLLALPHPFCSCCSSSLAPSLVQRGASTSFLLAFVVGSPMLNVTTMALAVAMLPAPYAALRIVGGLTVALVVTFAAARLAGTAEAGLSQPVRPAGDISAAHGRGPSALIVAWLQASLHLATVLIPTVVVTSVVASLVFDVLSPFLDNSPGGIIVAAIAGTVFMVPTWAEIPIALRLIDGGLTGPAAALLLALPAVSLPCLVVVGGALRRTRVVAVLGGAVMVVSLVAGLTAARLG